MMRWIRLFGLGLLTVVLAGADTAPSDAKPATAGRYVDGVQGFSMGAPASAPRVKERTVVATFQVGIDDGFVSNINVIVDPVKTMRDAYMESSFDQLKATNPGAKYNSIQKIEVSGKEAEYLDFEANMGAVPKRRLRFLQLVVVDDDRVYLVTCTAPVESFGAHQAEFKKCIDSFRLEK